jgi:hypothetical protein
MLTGGAEQSQRVDLGLATFDTARIWRLWGQLCAVGDIVCDLGRGLTQRAVFSAILGLGRPVSGVLTGQRGTTIWDGKNHSNTGIRVWEPTLAAVQLTTGGRGAVPYQAGVVWAERRVLGLEGGASSHGACHI